jgi:hypothetical protein
MHAYDHYAAKAMLNMTTTCPTCRRPTQLIDLLTLQSTDGPVRHAKVRCEGGHAYTVPLESSANGSAQEPVDLRAAGPQPGGVQRGRCRRVA